jgi:hypothetical protein
MAPHLELAKHAFGRELPLEHFDGSLDSAVADDNLEGLTLNGFAGHGRFASYKHLGLPARRMPNPSADDGKSGPGVNSLDAASPLANRVNTFPC